MIRSRLKKGIKKGLKKVLRVDISGPEPDMGVDARYRSSTAAPPPPPAAASPVSLVETAPVEAVPVEEAPVEEPVVEEAAVEEPVVQEVAAEEAAPEQPTMDAADDTAGEPLTMEAVQEILDDMVRPALQGDGGDISLLRIEDDNIYVKLVGSCSSCPSSIMTMKMGVEALLKEEFPQMKELIQEE